MSSCLSFKTFKNCSETYIRIKLFIFQEYKRQDQPSTNIITLLTRDKINLLFLIDLVGGVGLNPRPLV